MIVVTDIYQVLGSTSTSNQYQSTPRRVGSSTISKYLDFKSSKLCVLLFTRTLLSKSIDDER